MKHLLITLGVLSSSLLMAAPTSTTKDYSHNQSQKIKEQDKWPMYLELEGKKGNFRDIARLSCLIPLWQDDDSMLFGDVRFMMDDRSDREANIGLGYRKIIRDWDIGSNGVILGAYGFFDRRKSTLGNKYNQGTFGVEALGDYFRFSANYYAPQNKKHHINTTHNPVILDSGWNVIDQELVFTFNTLLNTKTNEEVTLKGYDAELRGKLPVNDLLNIWGGIGAYRFSRSGVKRDGPMAMVDVELLDALGIDGSRASLGFEYRKDKGFKATRYGVLKLTTPLASLGKEKPSQSLSGIEYEMTRFVLRDVDIQTGISQRPTKPTLSSGNTGTLENNSDNSTFLNVATGVLATIIKGTGDDTLDYFTEGAQAPVSSEISEKEKALINTLDIMAQKAPTDKLVVFLGVDDTSANGIMTFSEKELENAFNFLKSNTDYLSPDQISAVTSGGANALPVLNNVIFIGASDTALNSSELITEEGLSSTISNIEGLDADVFQSHLDGYSGNFSLKKDAVSPSVLGVEGSILFAEDAEEAGFVLENGAVYAVASVNGPLGDITPALKNFRENSFEGVNSVSVYFMNQGNVDSSTISGSLIMPYDASAFVGIEPKLFTIPSVNTSSAGQYPNAYFTSFTTDVDAAALSAAIGDNSLSVQSNAFRHMMTANIFINGAKELPNIPKLHFIAYSLSELKLATTSYSISKYSASLWKTNFSVSNGSLVSVVDQSDDYTSSEVSDASSISHDISSTNPSHIGERVQDITNGSSGYIANDLCKRLAVYIAGKSKRGNLNYYNSLENYEPQRRNGNQIATRNYTEQLYHIFDGMNNLENSSELSGIMDRIRASRTAQGELEYQLGQLVAEKNETDSSYLTELSSTTGANEAVAEVVKWIASDYIFINSITDSGQGVVTAARKALEYPQPYRQDIASSISTKISALSKTKAKVAKAQVKAWSPVGTDEEALHDQFLSEIKAVIGD